MAGQQRWPQGEPPRLGMQVPSTGASMHRTGSLGGRRLVRVPPGIVVCEGALQTGYRKGTLGSYALNIQQGQGGPQAWHQQLADCAGHLRRS